MITSATKDNGFELARSDVVRRSARTGDSAAAVRTVNAFGADLAARLVAADPGSNLLFSPASVAVALTMTSAGATGTTLTAMDAVLHIDDPDRIHHSMNALTAALTERTRREGRGEVILEVTSSIWAQSGLALQAGFLDVLAGEYGSGVRLVDYRHQPEEARTAINGWVDEATHERIPALLGQGAITERTRLTLVNTVYLKAAWQSVFETSDTRPHDFTTAAGPTVTASMMHRTARFSYAESAGWRAVEVPYLFGDLVMTVVVPDGDVAPPIDDVVGALAPANVRLGLPRFDFGTSTSLSAVLAEMGMATTFADSADFRGITTEEPLLISDVIHQANITVDEDGTEAAAATAVLVGAGAAPGPTDEPIELTIDRPFVFVIRDVATGAVLFHGRVADPTVS